MMIAEAPQRISNSTRTQLPGTSSEQDFVRLVRVTEPVDSSAKGSLRWRLIGSSVLGASVTSAFLFNAPEFASICVFGIVCYICGVIAGTAAR